MVAKRTIYGDKFKLKLRHIVAKVIMLEANLSFRLRASNIMFN
ncbi:MAG: hypothetical protein ACJAXS_002068 [Colwellia sp.]|jgi:hypothetical protein